MSASELLVRASPIVPLATISSRVGHLVYGKCEQLHPTGSVKDRIGSAMISWAERDGLLSPGATIVEATAGNTGAALAAVAIPRGYRMVVTMSDKVSETKRAIMRAWGAEVIICPTGVPPDSPDSFLVVASTIAHDRPGHVYIDQFRNPANLEAHTLTTGPEIWRQTKGEVAAVIGGVGTGGTLMGVAKSLRKLNPSIRIVLADPVGSVLAAAVEGRREIAAAYRIEGIGGDFIPPLFDPREITDAYSVADEEAFAAAAALRADEGLWVGGSSGCALAAAYRFGSQLEPRGQTLVVILTDGGRNYVDTDAGSRAGPCT